MTKQNNQQQQNKSQQVDELWGKQTNLSLAFFNIGTQVFSSTFIQGLINIKRACAEVNHDQGLLSSERSQAIVAACDELLQNDYAEQFPLRVWQTGSGTQTNMNVNEVICSLANKIMNGTEVHPNDHVNMSQSSNDVFPTAMHLSAASLTKSKLLKSLALLYESLQNKEREFKTIIMVGRTHMMDALPLPVSSMFAAYGEQLAQAKRAIEESLEMVYKLAIGGTAVGGGDNAPAQFGSQVASRLAERYSLPFQAANNRYAAVSGEDALIRFMSALKQLASVLNKMANDFRLLGSGPRCGFNEWLLPANEPGSSIMPGKVNPTQCEALTMVCLQVFGNELTVSLAASSGQLQLNTYRPVIIHNVMESITLISDAMASFANNCVQGLALNDEKIKTNMTQNLSVITLLAPTIGYDVASQIVKEANNNNLSLAQAAEELGLFSGEQFEILLKEHINANDS